MDNNTTDSIYTSYSSQGPAPLLTSFPPSHEPPHPEPPHTTEPLRPKRHHHRRPNTPLPTHPISDSESRHVFRFRTHILSNPHLHTPSHNLALHHRRPDSSRHNIRHPVLLHPTFRNTHRRPRHLHTLTILCLRPAAKGTDTGSLQQLDKPLPLHSRRRGSKGGVGGCRDGNECA